MISTMAVLSLGSISSSQNLDGKYYKKEGGRCKDYYSGLTYIIQVNIFFLIISPNFQEFIQMTKHSSNLIVNSKAGFTLYWIALFFDYLLKIKAYNEIDGYNFETSVLMYCRSQYYYFCQTQQRHTEIINNSRASPVESARPVIPYFNKKPA